MRRYRRKQDSYQQQDAFRELFLKMKLAVYPDAIADEKFKKLLFAIQYYERHPLKESKSGRRAAFDDTFLFNSAAKIRAVLESETGGRISLLRFISTYLPMINYPKDLLKALDDYRINLEEARILARINRKNLGLNVKRKPSEFRREILESHLKRAGTQMELKMRVDQKLNTSPKRQAETVAANVALIDISIDELLEFNEFDTEHLLWEEIKGLVYLMRDVDASLLEDETTEQILRSLDEVKLKLFRYKQTAEP